MLVLDKRNEPFSTYPSGIKGGLIEKSRRRSYIKLAYEVIISEEWKSLYMIKICNSLVYVLSEYHSEEARYVCELRIIRKS